MFKRLAILAVYLSCVGSYASSHTPFGIGIEKTNIKDIQKEIVTKPSTVKQEDIAGYKETFLNAENFSLNDHCPDFAKVFANSDGVVEALSIEYKTDNASDLIADLDKKYQKTFSGKTIFGSYNDEYRNGNCLIRIVKPFGGKTLLLYGTIKWFNAYDEHYKQGAEIRQKRREFIKELDIPAHCDENIVLCHERAFNEKFNRLRRECFSNFWNFDDFGDFSESIKKSLGDEDNAKVKSYKTRKQYSKIGDVEEWLYDDNGDVTRIKKTPEGTTVIHGDKAGNVAKTKEEMESRLLYGRQIRDANL